MKTITQRIYMVILTILILIPVVLYAVIGKYLDSSTADKENRVMTEMPTLANTQISEFPTLFDAYMNDNLPYKNYLVTINSMADYYLFNTSSSDDVIVGDKGWLFYVGHENNDEDPLADYEGTNLYSIDELEIIAENMTNARDFLASQGKEFVVTIIPNKSRVYSEYMPDMCGDVSQECRLNQVYQYLSENTDLTIVSPYNDIVSYKEAHPETQLYFKYDTHWNNFGAYVAAQSISRVWGFEMPDLDTVEQVYVDSDTYDLARMINLGDYLKEDAPIATAYSGHMARVEIQSDGMSFTGTVDQGTADARKLYIIGDSFSALLFPYLACHFNSSKSDMYYNYNYSSLESYDPDVVVFECVERYLNNMLHFSIENGVVY
ncbi:MULTISPECIES: alginate O-acetyltransferase AlgX-related protein [Butyrivibrio]|jgi:hypothetical protein|uniref:alginate O-acetyltransferase AlgX-related protein n=1 Tax=Butyrivibrio TaxID=830 RepID=UPI0003B76348|nr:MULTISPECIES: hypothetical protein [Butyrivibrio]SEP88894.1 SGNH hydrolase-like domain-containing protein, acetyltransferase AlgX [Butyrivibrio sp. TB]